MPCFRLNHPMHAVTTGTANFVQLWQVLPIGIPIRSGIWTECWTVNRPLLADRTTGAGRLDSAPCRSGSACRRRQSAGGVYGGRLPGAGWSGHPVTYNSPGQLGRPGAVRPLQFSVGSRPAILGRWMCPPQAPLAPWHQQKESLLRQRITVTFMEIYGRRDA